MSQKREENYSIIALPYTSTVFEIILTFSAEKKRGERDRKTRQVDT